MTTYLGIEATITFTPRTCPMAGCGITYALTEQFYKERRQDGGSWYCPNGHSLHVIETDLTRARKEAERLAERLEWANRSAANAQEDARAAHASLVTTKGHLTRARKRAIHAVCPCCNRSFANVRRHIESQHPDKLAELDGGQS